MAKHDEVTKGFRAEVGEKVNPKDRLTVLGETEKRQDSIENIHDQGFERKG